MKKIIVFFVNFFAHFMGALLLGLGITIFVLVASINGDYSVMHIFMVIAGAMAILIGLNLLTK